MVKDRDYDDQRDEPTRPLDQDYDTPFSPPNDTGKQKLPIDHPAGDTEVDEHEEYDEGPSDAAVDNPPEGDAGAGPRPTKLS